ncbi:MAG: dephospho-CoA kinase [Alphaproteobacteria bacterium]
MLVIGLTGGIGMGKSSASAHFRKRGIPVFDADAFVHALYEGAAVPAIEAAFPGTVRDGRVDRARLAKEIAHAPQRLAELEGIVHPLVVQAEIDFLCEEERKGTELAVLDIPLLFETGAEARVDVTIAFSTPVSVQRERVLARPGMTRERFEALLTRQHSDAERRAKADFVVDSASTLENLHRQLDQLIESLQTRNGEVMAQLRGQESQPAGN